MCAPRICFQHKCPGRKATAQNHLNSRATPFIALPTDAVPPASFSLVLGSKKGQGGVAAAKWAVSSAVEHYVDIVVATGSIPVPPTILAANLVAGSPRPRYVEAQSFNRRTRAAIRRRPMKVKNSLRSLKLRHRDCQVVRRKGRVYVINKTQKRYKARQG